MGGGFQCLSPDDIKNLMRSKNSLCYFSFYIDNISIKHIPLENLPKNPT